jgi:hypothetical protein
MLSKQRFLGATDEKTSDCAAKISLTTKRAQAGAKNISSDWQTILVEGNHGRREILGPGAIS